MFLFVLFFILISSPYLGGRALSAAPNVAASGARSGSPSLQPTAEARQRRLSVSEGFSLKKLPSSSQFYVSVIECEAKDVIDPLFWKVKFDGSKSFVSAVSVTGRWQEWASGMQSKDMMRFSLWTKKDGHKNKLGYADFPITDARGGKLANEWLQLLSLEGKPLPGIRIRALVSLDSADAASEDELLLVPSSPNDSEHSTPSAGRRSSSMSEHRPSLAVASPLGGVLRRDTSAIVKMLEGRPAPIMEREAQWRKFFELSETDLLVGDWSAAFMKGVARHGRLYVFTDHLCFHSNLFGVKTMFVIPFVDVLGVEKTVENLTPGIRLRAADKVYNFGGIYARQPCFDMITNIWKGSYVLVEEAELQGSLVTEAEEQKLMEEKFPEELLSAKEYEKDGFLGGVDELSELLQEDLPLTPTRFFQYFVGNESTFEKDYHEARGDTDVKVEAWKPHETFGQTRNLFYILKLSGPIGPPTTRTEEVHRYHLQKDRLIIDTSMNMLDAPYGDYFRVESQWIINLNEDGTSSHIRISAKAVFMKSTMMKGTISSRTLAGMTESFKFWITQARALIATRQPQTASPSKQGSAGTLSKSSSNQNLNKSATTGSAASRAAPAHASGGGVLGIIGGAVGALLSRESLTHMILLMNLVVQVLLVYVLVKILNKL